MKTLYLALLLSLSIPFMSQAQDEYQENLPNILKMNPVSFAFGNFNLTYERALNKSTSLQIGANYWYNIFDEDVSGFGVRIGYRFYVTNRVKSSPEGFYVGPLVSYNNLRDRGVDNPVSGSTFGVGGLIGYQWVWKSGVTFDLGLGPTLTFASNSNGEKYEGFLPNLVLAVGYNF